MVGFQGKRPIAGQQRVCRHLCRIHDVGPWRLWQVPRLFRDVKLEEQGLGVGV